MSNDVFEIVQNDLEPDFGITVADGAATFDQAVSWKFNFRLTPRDTTIVDTSPTVVLSGDNKTATVSHRWVAGETDTTTETGQATVSVIWPGGREQTFPPRGYKRFIVSPDLG